MADETEVKLETRIAQGMGYFNRTCELCGEGYETNALSVELFDTDDIYASVSLCPECIKAGQVGASQRILSYAERLDRCAAWLRFIAPKVASISDSDWVTAEKFKAEFDKHNAEMQSDLERDKAFVVSPTVAVDEIPF